MKDQRDKICHFCGKKIMRLGLELTARKVFDAKLKETVVKIASFVERTDSHEQGVRLVHFDCAEEYAEQLKEATLCT